jgi:hypothetical protein
MQTATAGFIISAHPQRTSQPFWNFFIIVVVVVAVAVAAAVVLPTLLGCHMEKVSNSTHITQKVIEFVYW